MFTGWPIESGENLTALRYRSMHTFGFPYPTTVIPIIEEVSTVTGNDTVTENVTVGYNKSSAYSNFFDDTRNQRKEFLYEDFDGFMWNMYRDIDFEHNGELLDGNMRINSYGGAIWGDFFQWNNVHTMGPLYLIACTVTLIYATYDIGSFFLSFMALWEVVLMLPIAVC